MHRRGAALLARAAARATWPASQIGEAQVVAAASHLTAIPGSQSTLAGLDRPPPSKIVVEYDSAEVDRFIEAADAIEDAFPGLIVDGIEIEDRPGAFDISLEDGTTVYQRATASADIPDNDDLIGQLSAAGVRPAS